MLLPGPKRRPTINAQREDSVATANLLLDTKSTLGEGPIWDDEEDCLWWIDIEVGLVHRFDPARHQNQTFDIGRKVGTVVRRQRGGLMLALADGFAAFDPKSGRLEILCDPEADKPDNRFNDGKCDPAGRFWAGSMNALDESQPTGALYCLHADGHVVKHFEGVRVSNGIVWTADAKTMYYIDSPTRCVDSFEYDRETGQISNRQTVIQFSEDQGYPDGMTIDAEDMLWVAQWDGWGVSRFDPKTGELLDKIEVPAAQVTACAFGGPELKDLFITTARRGIEAGDLEEQPYAGSLFHARPGVMGVRSNQYAG